MNETRGQGLQKSAVALHYGNMRFAMFTVFTAVLGALLAFPFSDGGRATFSEHPDLRKFLSTAALVLCSLFTLAEIRISTLVSFYQLRAFDETYFPKPPGKSHEFWSVLVTLTMISPYIFSALFWLFFALSDFTVPAAK